MCPMLGVYAKQTKDSTATSILQQKGYVGTLPDILDKFRTKKPEKGTPIFEAEEGFDDPDKLKPVPRDNPAFVDIILKKDKTSTYVNDISRIIPQVEGLIDSIENDEWVKNRTIKFGTVPKKLINNNSFWRVYLPLYRADYSLIGNYKFEKLDLSCDIPATVFYSETDTPRSEMELWTKYFRGKCDFYQFDGSHFFIKDHHLRMAEIISEAFI